MPAIQTEPCPACGAILDITGAQIFAERTCPVCGTPIHVRRKFGHYELTEVLGHGGQGLVYKAVDNNLNRLVALKLLRTEYSEDPEFVRQFESEARVTASINHPNVVRVFSFGADEGHVYLAMELVAKGTLDDLMEKLGRVPEARALQIGIDIAQGLRAGHEMGLVHRDVKPGNILFGEDGSAKIVDFGLAMFLEQEAASSGEIWGTPYYLSPERLNRVTEDFRSDVYSLGATLFHAIAGRPPFEAEDATGVAMKHLKANAVSIQAWASDVTNATAFVINRTLSKNADERCGSYEEFIEQLQYAREEALRKAQTGPTKQKSRVVIEDASSRKVNSLLTIATLIVLVVGVAVGAWIIIKSGGDKAKPASNESIESFGTEWLQARNSLASGASAKAVDEFRALADSSSGAQKAWAIIFQALASQVGGDTKTAISTLERLDTSTPHGKFFASFAPSLNAPVFATSGDSLNRSNYEALANLFLGIRAYDGANVEAAQQLLRNFTTFKPERDYEFLSDFKKIARPYDDDITTFSMVMGQIKTAKNVKERAAGLAALKGFESKLTPNNRLVPAIKDGYAYVEKIEADELARRRAANIAVGAKISVDSWNEQKGDAPAQAVDGDPSTRWSSNNAGDKWMQFDFGAPKTVGRWVLKLAPPPAPGVPATRINLNRLRDFKLQSSTDGKTWTDVDSVFGSRVDAVDRLVKPFSAQYARVLVTRGSWDLKDKSARIFEVEFTDASEQAKTTNAPSDPIAVRSSPDSPFSLVPIGPLSVAGSAAYDPVKKSYTLQGAGEDIWGVTDSFQFLEQGIEGDFEFVARVTKVQGPHPWSKLGIMVRTDLTRDSSMAVLAAAPEAKAQFISRKEAAKPAVAVDVKSRPLPIWLKLVRSGPTVTGYESTDGKKWAKLGEDTPKNLGPICSVGLVACAHHPSGVAIGEIDNVTITPVK